ncbi:MAG: 3-oxoacyl-[acyl-carrier-protein] reductase FabG [Verrucomicrobiae bacterium]|nr:3-oxoacyl-[acyl-carrier-protein] reductase FabG [Verrucomicrobiae bacterium]
MQNLMEGKVVVVTGAGRGIGKAIALRLAGEGASVACCGRTLANVESTVKEIAGKARAYAVDVADGSQVGATCEKVLQDFGRVDVLVNNAGVTRDGLLMRMSDSDWDTVLDTNLKGAFLFTKALTRSMLKQRSGRIINISSISGLTGNAGQSNYAASKAGLIGFTKSVARELASRGITANAVAPGFIVTDMTHVLSAEMQEQLKQRIALGRLGAAEDIANAVLFLASDMASYVTGQVLTVDGGLTM